MGFDLHGMNPVVRKGKMPDRPDSLWNKETPEKVRNEYFDKKWEFEENNPGAYFRNNCWWWRPLWNYVCCECDDILDQEDLEHGNYNDGHLITEEKACAIAKRLFELIDEGEVKGYEDFHKKQSDEANANNERYLANGGEKYGDGWDWTESYPFSVDNVRAFAEFCAESGGFEIC